jgi:hypothetical protein
MSHIVGAARFCFPQIARIDADRITQKRRGARCAAQSQGKKEEQIKVISGLAGPNTPFFPSYKPNTPMLPYPYSIPTP